MAGLNIGNIPRISAPQLRSFLSSSTSASSLSIIDVRDSDYIGGHIRGCIHTPTSTHDTALTELARKLQDKKVVVFHCMLSMQRGPGAALRYARERERLLKATPGEGAVAVGTSVLDGVKSLEEDKVAAAVESGTQVVAVLEFGFQGWVQSGYGDDERLTEGFVRDLWEDEID